MALAGLGLVARITASAAVWWWAGLYVLCAVLGPLFYIVMMVQRGRLSDLDIQHREQRARPMVITVGGVGLALVLSWLGGAPQLLIILAAGSLAQMILILVITLRWKISMHSASAAGMAVLAWNVVGQAALPFVIGVPVIAWSRIRLKRHTPAQTLAGAALGTLVFLIAFALARR